jgi:hypothetical protein
LALQRGQMMRPPVDIETSVADRTVRTGTRSITRPIVVQSNCRP